MVTRSKSLYSVVVQSGWTHITSEGLSKGTGKSDVIIRHIALICNSLNCDEEGLISVRISLEAHKIPGYMRAIYHFPLLPFTLMNQ